jgi:hypothetical protein
LLQTMTAGKIAKVFLLGVVGVLLSFILALVSLKATYNSGLWYYTPGEIVARKVFPPNPSAPFSSLGQDMALELAIDTAAWLLLICGLLFVIVRLRRKFRD